MTRPTSFDYAFRELADQRFATIRSAAAATHADTSDFTQFVALPGVQEILAEVEVPELLAESPQAAAEYLMTLFVAFRFWDAGCRVFPIDRQRLEAAIAARPSRPVPDVPHGACYLQLPARWFWARVADAAPHEPVDGLFVCQAGTSSELTVLAVLGLRAERGGFSQIVVRAPRSEIEAAGAVMRTPPFDPVLEGGKAAGLRSLTSVGDLLHLAHLALLETAR